MLTAGQPARGPAPLNRVAMRVKGTLVHELAPLDDVGIQQRPTALEDGDGEAEDPTFRRDKHTVVALVLARQIGKKVGDSTIGAGPTLLPDASPHELPRRVLRGSKRPGHHRGPRIIARAHVDLSGLDFDVLPVTAHLANGWNGLDSVKNARPTGWPVPRRRPTERHVENLTTNGSDIRPFCSVCVHPEEGRARAPSVLPS
jgi:hypothetical protein